MASFAWKWDLKGGGSGREKVENKTRRGTRSFGGRPFLGGRWWRRWKPMGHPKRVPRRKTKSPVMTGKRSTQLVGTGRGRVERRSPSAKANLTSHFHSTCSWQPVRVLDYKEDKGGNGLWGGKGGGKKGFVEPKLTEGEKAQGQQPPSTSRISAKDFPEIRARTLDYTMNLRNHLWLIYIYIRRFVIKINGSCRSRLSDRKKEESSLWY